MTKLAMLAALRRFSFAFNVFAVQRSAGMRGRYPVQLDCDDFNHPCRNPELSAHAGWRLQTLWNRLRSESWENIWRNLFRWIRDEASPGIAWADAACRSVAAAWLLEEVCRRVSAERVTIRYLEKEAASVQIAKAAAKARHRSKN